jgi:hypothetical protein
MEEGAILFIFLTMGEPCSSTSPSRSAAGGLPLSPADFLLHLHSGARGHAHRHAPTTAVSPARSRVPPMVDLTEGYRVTVGTSTGRRDRSGCRRWKHRAGVHSIQTSRAASPFYLDAPSLLA